MHVSFNYTVFLIMIYFIFFLTTFKFGFRCDAGYRDDDCSKLDPEVIYFQTTIATFVIVMVLVVFGVFTFSYMIAKK